jgi:hypothetical protein
MRPVKTCPTYDEALSEALKYNRPADFKRGSPSAFAYFANRGEMASATAHMTKKLRRWSDDEIAAEAMKYNTRAEFYAGSRLAHAAACKRGILQEVTAHMPKKPEWTFDNCEAESLKYNTRTDFRFGNPSAYVVAKRNKWLDKICAHMRTVKYGFDRKAKAILYYLRVKTSKQVLYKIGVSNFDVDRRYSIEKAEFDVIKVWEFESGAVAQDNETDILKKHKDHLYSGPRVLSSGGNSELFTHDVLGLDAA